MKYKTGTQLASKTNKNGGKMKRTLLTSGLVAGVLMSGLVGCNNGTKKTVDRFNAPPPLILRNGGSMSAEEWKLQQSKELDLQDEIDASSSGAASLEVTTSCSRIFLQDDGSNIKISSDQVLTIPTPGRIKVYRLIPSDNLTRKIGNTELTCSFDLKLKNAAGSAIVYSMNSIGILDNKDADVIIASSKGNTTVSEQDLKISAENLNSASFFHPSTAFAELVCRDANFLTLPFNKSSSIQFFDQNNVQAKPGREPYFLQSHPEQPCRILIRQNGQVIGLSALFTLKIEIQGAVVKMGPSVYSDQDLIMPGKYWNAFLQPQIQFEVSNLVVSNQSKYHRKIKIFRKRFKAITAAYTANHAYLREGEFLDLYYKADNGDVKISEETAEYWIFEVPPFQSFGMGVRLTNPGTPFCLIVDGAALPDFAGLGVTPNEKGQLIEMSMDGSLIQELPFDLGYAFALPRGDDHFALPGTLLLGLPTDGCGR